MELPKFRAVESAMEGLREFKVMLLGAENAPERPISVLARTPTIALCQGAAIALDYAAEDFTILPGARANWPYRY